MTYADVIYVSKRTPKETEASIESSLRADPVIDPPQADVELDVLLAPYGVISC